MSDKLKFGTVGTNFISDTFAEAVQLSETAEIYSVYSRSRETGENFAAKYGISGERVYTSLGELANSGINAVYIASPNKFHFEQSMFFLNRGIHVLCEKPAAADAGEYEIMQNTAKERGAVLLEAMRPAHDPAWPIIENAIPRIGRIRHAAFEYCQYSSRYKRHLSGEHTNTFDPALCNAALMDIGIYPLYCLIMLFGEPLSVSANSVFLENGFEASGELTLSYGGFTASALYSKVYDSKRSSAIFGEDGAIFIDKLSSPGEVFLWLRDGNITEKLPVKGETNNMVWEIRRFAELVRNGSACHEYTDVTAAVLRTIDKARRLAGIRWNSAAGGQV